MEIDVFGQRCQKATWYNTGMDYYQWSRPDTGRTVGLSPLVPKILDPKCKPIIEIDGGRISGKDTAVAQCLILQANHIKDRGRILVIQEANALSVSLFMDFLWDWIRKMGLKDNFRRQGNEIIHEETETTFVYEIIRTSIHAQSRDYRWIRQLKNFHVCWITEGQNMSRLAWEELEPTIRGGGGHIVITMNRCSLDDPIDREVIQRASERDDVTRITWNYDQNPFLTKDALDYIAGAKKNYPERFAHVWLGEPDSVEEPVIIEGNDPETLSYYF